MSLKQWVLLIVVGIMFLFIGKFEQYAVSAKGTWVLNPSSSPLKEEFECFL